jgi:hypothetical protein
LIENQSPQLVDSIREARERVALALRAEGEQIKKLELEVTELRLQHERNEQEATRQWEEIARTAELALAPPAEPEVSPDMALEGVLSAVRNLMTCTLPEQVFEVVTQEAVQGGVRAAVFDVRGKAAWGAAANGFGPTLSEKLFRSVIVPLNQDNPFRKVCETAAPVDASAETLKRTRNVLEKLKPPLHAPVLLLPIRSGGTVSAVLYADPGANESPLPVNALKILSEFAGAQIDRLIALGGGISTEVVPEASVEETPVEVAPEQPAPVEIPAEIPVAEGVAAAETVVAETITAPHAEAEVPAPEFPVTEPPPSPVEVAVEEPEPVAPVVEISSVPLVEEVPVEVAPPAPVEEPAPPPAPPAPTGFDISHLSEADQKMHKDAKRFAKLLVTEIELYNKAKVADGRKNKDLYKRLKSDIDRSRQTFEKRFGKDLSKQFDYLHEEIVKTLAVNDAAALGPGYPGPSA